MNKFAEQNKDLDVLLELKRHVCGVRFLDEKEYKEAKATELKYKLPYCVMVKSASAGHAIKARADNFGCKAAARALGFIKPQESFLSGEDGFAFGIYETKEVARSSSCNITLCEEAHYGIQIAPLQEFDKAPDVVIIVTVPYNAMRLIQAHTFHYGNSNQFKMGGLQALCSESTAYPYMTGNMNVSMLCAGTRYISGWKEDEVAVSIPYCKLEAVIDGLWNTVNPLERDAKKHRIEDGTKDIPSKKISICYGKNYDTGLYRFGKNGKK